MWLHKREELDGCRNYSELVSHDWILFMYNFKCCADVTLSQDCWVGPPECSIKYPSHMWDTFTASDNVPLQKEGLITRLIERFA